MIKLFQPYVNLKAKENVIRVLGSGQIAQGPEVDLFEKDFAEKFGFEPWQIVTLNSGTSALELAYDLCGISALDEVITPVLTCTATNIPLVRRGAKIIFADVEGKKSLNADYQDVFFKLTRDTKAIVFVHFGGSSSDLKEFERLSKENKVDLICDAAQALGAEISKTARFSCISLQAIKSLTSGDGGILICRDLEDAKKARKLRWFGYDREEKQRLGDIDLEIAGYKMHMNDINAAIARGNLEDWDMIVEHRQTLNNAYESYGKGKGFIRGVWNPCVIGIEYEPARAKLESEGIQIGQYHYPNSKYSVFFKAEKHCPNMDSLNDKYFMLPCHMGVSIADAEKIGEILWPKD